MCFWPKFIGEITQIYKWNWLKFEHLSILYFYFVLYFVFFHYCFLIISKLEMFRKEFRFKKKKKKKNKNVLNKIQTNIFLLTKCRQLIICNYKFDAFKTINNSFSFFVTFKNWYLSLSIQYIINKNVNVYVTFITYVKWPKLVLCCTVFVSLDIYITNIIKISLSLYFCCLYRVDLYCWNIYIYIFAIR